MKEEEEECGREKKEEWEREFTKKRKCNEVGKSEAFDPI